MAVLTGVDLTHAPLSTTGNVNEAAKFSELAVSVIYNNISDIVSTFYFL
jgi:hypothetical protein